MTPDPTSALLRRYRALASRRRALAVLDARSTWYRTECARLEAEIRGLEAQRAAKG